MVTKPGRIVTLLDGLLHKKVALLFDHLILRNHVKNLNSYISITTVLMATKLGRLVTNLLGFLPMLLDPFSHVVT